MYTIIHQNTTSVQILRGREEGGSNNSYYSPESIVQREGNKKDSSTPIVDTTSLDKLEAFKQMENTQRKTDVLEANILIDSMSPTARTVETTRQQQAQTDSMLYGVAGQRVAVGNMQGASVKPGEYDASLTASTQYAQKIDKKPNTTSTALRSNINTTVNTPVQTVEQPQPTLQDQLKGARQKLGAAMTGITLDAVKDKAPYNKMKIEAEQEIAKLNDLIAKEKNAAEYAKLTPNAKALQKFKNELSTLEKNINNYKSNFNKGIDSNKNLKLFNEAKETQQSMKSIVATLEKINQGEQFITKNTSSTDVFTKSQVDIATTAIRSLEGKVATQIATLKKNSMYASIESGVQTT